MLQQVGKARLERLEVLLVQVGLGNAAMVLQRADRGNHHDGIGLEPGKAALDVQELLCAQVGAEAGLRHAVVAQGQAHVGGHDGVAAVRDVREGAAVHERRGAFQGLHQVRLQGVLQQGRHGAFSVQVVRGDGLVVAGVAHHDAAQALLQVGDGGCQAEDGHDLGGNRDVEAVFTGHTVCLAAQAAHDVAQLAVVHVNHALPGDAAHVDAQLVAVVDMGVEQRGKQVVGRADGMEVAREVQVDLLHGDHLGVPAAGSAALDAEHGAQGGLAQGDDGVLAQVGKRVAQADGGGGLALARGGGVDGRYQHKLAGGVLLVSQQVVVYLGLRLAVALKVVFLDAGLLGHFHDGARRCRLRDLDIAQHTIARFLFLLQGFSSRLYFVISP